MSYPPKSAAQFMAWMDRVCERRRDEFAYIRVVPCSKSCNPMVPVIALSDDEGMLFARITVKAWRLVVHQSRDVDPASVTEMFGLPVLHERREASV